MNALITKAAIPIIVTLTMGLLSGCQQEGLTGERGISEDRPFAYVVRDFPDMGDTSSPEVRPKLDPRDPYQFNPGARLYVQDRIALNSERHEILKSYFGDGSYDVKDLSISPDGDRISFAAHGPEGNTHDSSWNIFEYDFSTKKLRRFFTDDAFADAGQDTNPAYTNDGRIVFSSDRQTATGDFQVVDNREYIADYNEPASLLHIMNPDGSNIVQITFGTYHDIEPNSMNDGQLVFIRWGREYETLYDCTAQNIDDPNFNTHPHGGGYGHGNGSDFPSGLDDPKTWTTDDKCGGSIAGITDGTRIFIRDILSLYRIAPSGGNMHRYFGSLNEAASDASFIHYMDPIPTSDGNLITIMRHIFNPVYGGDVVKINSQNFYAVGQPVNDTVTGEAEQSMTPGLVNFYPNQISPTGWYSAVFPYRDGSNRLLASWASCLILTGEVNAACEGSSTTTELVPPQYGIWAIDPVNNTRLPVVKGQEQSLYTDIVIGKYNDNAVPYSSPQPDFLLNDGFGAFHIRSVYDVDGQDMAAPDGGITTLRDPSLTRPDNRSERFIRVLTTRSIPSDLEQAILDSPILNPTDGSGPRMGLRPILGSGGTDLHDILSYGMIEPDGSATIQVPHDVQFTFEIVNKYGKRVDLIAEPGYNYNYLVRHPQTMLLEDGELRQCNGCHDPANDIPHARPDVQTASANPGAPGSGLPFPNANPQIIASRYGDSMAATLSLYLGSAPTGTTDVVYQDYWTNPYGSTPPQPSFTYSHSDLNTPAPYSDPACLTNWTSDCKTTINYLEHIQPIWDLCRATADNKSCTSCHDKADNNPAAKCPGGGGAGGDLVLSGDPDPWNPKEVASYVQLFEADYYQKNENGEWVLVTDPATECVNGIEGDLSIQPQDGKCITRRLMSARGAIASARFFRLFDDDPDDNAYEIEAKDPIGANKDLSFHKGMLTAAELRLIAEWLDTGAHYYNDTDKYVLPTE